MSVRGRSSLSYEAGWSVTGQPTLRPSWQRVRERIQVVALPEKASLVFAVFTATATQPPERQDTIEYLVFQGLEW